jgi:hypothetical protein
MLGSIYRTLERMELLATSQFHFGFPRVEVSQNLVFSSNQMREGGDLRCYSESCSVTMKIWFSISCCAVQGSIQFFIFPSTVLLLPPRSGVLC